jgi:3-hydroxyacyl-[acyl-carrier-protein] dehydratase
VFVTHPFAHEEKDMLDVEQIRAVLPHRYPMLLVDRVLEMDPGKRAVGLKNVTANEDFFNGHFPGRSMMPGVLIIEAMAQVGGVLMLSMPEHYGRLPVIGAVENARFRKPVVPGDTLVTEVEVLYFRRGFGKVRLTGRVDNEVVASCEMVFGIVDASAGAPAAGQE